MKYFVLHFFFLQAGTPAVRSPRSTSSAGLRLGRRSARSREAAGGHAPGAVKGAASKARVGQRERATASGSRRGWA